MNVKDLQEVCARLLDNANLDVEFDAHPFRLRLLFDVCGAPHKVIFTCANITRLCIEKAAEDEPLYVCLEASVTEPAQQWPPTRELYEYQMLPPAEKQGYLWRIQVAPEAQLDIQCLSFEWKIVERGGTA